MFSSSKAYSLNDELLKAQAAKAAGKKVILLIGRGSKQGVIDSDSDKYYCYLSPMRENFALTADKSYSELITTLINLPKNLCKNLFNAIVIDGGTINHIINDFSDNLDADTQLAATFISAEIASGKLYDASNIARLPAPIIYQFESLSLIYYEFLLRMLAEMSSDDLRLTIPFGKDIPWSLEKSRQISASLLKNVQVSDDAVLCLYLMSRKESAYKIETSGEKNQLLPRNLEAPDQHNGTNEGAMMFLGYVGHFRIDGLLLDIKNAMSTSKTPAQKKSNL